MADLLTGSVEALFVARAAGLPMEAASAVDALAGQGLSGDRYAEDRGFYSPGCEVTLIEAEVLERAIATSGLKLGNGEHRRNIVTRGIRVHALIGQRFSLGGAVLEHDRARPPCAYLESLTERGIMRALSGARAGICATVVESGRIAVGDAIVVLEPSGPPVTA